MYVSYSMPHAPMSRFPPVPAVCSDWLGGPDRQGGRGGGHDGHHEDHEYNEDVYDEDDDEKVDYLGMSQVWECR